MDSLGRTSLIHLMFICSMFIVPFISNEKLEGFFAFSGGFLFLFIWEWSEHMKHEDLKAKKTFILCIGLSFLCSGLTLFYPISGIILLVGLFLFWLNFVSSLEKESE